MRLRALSPPPLRLGRPPLPVLALGLALFGQLLMTGRGGPWVGAVLLGLSGALIGVAALRAASAGTPAPVDRPAVSPDEPEERLVDGLVGGRAGLASLVLVTLVAAAFRLPWLGQVPPGLAPDEARVGLDALEVLKSGWSSGSWHGWPVFHLGTIASIAALGPTALAVRLPSALAGVAFAPALFLLGRQIGGTRLGAVAGLLGAVAFWHADLTRGAWGYGAWGLACETFGLAVLLQAIRRPSPGATALAGLTLGLALQASWAALAAVGAGALLAASRVGVALGSRRQVVSALAPLVVYFAVAAGPVLIGMCVPDQTPRATGTGGAGTITTFDVVGRATRLLLMFNVAGDPSPLHNLRAEPMLDLATAALLVLGVCLALVRWRDPVLRTLILWLAATLGLAMLASNGEQPDGVAVSHALAPALLLAGAALIGTAGGLHPRHGSTVAWQLDLTLAVIAVIVGINAHALYVRRPADFATWLAYAGPETVAAREISRYTPNHVIYLADAWIDHPTIRFLARDLGTPLTVDPATTFPLRRDQSFAYFSPGNQEVVPEDLERLYEDGEIDRYRSPLDDNYVAARSFHAPSKVVAEARGVTLRASTGDRARPNRYTLQELDLDWPLPGEPARSASLDLFTALLVDRPGVYRLRMDGPPGAILEINGVQVGGPGQEVDVTLAAGSQRLHITGVVDGKGHVEVRWAPPGSSVLVEIPPERLYREQRAAIGLLALYRSGEDPAAPPELARVERHLQRSDHQPVLARPYVVDWVGILDAPKSGTYRFKLDASGPASLWIDDRPVVLGMPVNGAPVSTVLTEGDHRVQVRLTDEAGPTRLDLAWAPPGEDLGAISTSRFEPPNAPVDAIRPVATSPDSAFVSLGAPRVRWLASTEGEPRAVAVRPDGDVFLTNIGSRQVQQVIGEGESLLGLPAGVSVPSDVEVGPDGRVWAVDSLLGDVVRLDHDGAVDLTIDNRTMGLYRPRGLAIAPDGTILVADTGGSRVVRLAPDGTILAKIGSEVGGPERIRQPTDVAVGPDGDLFVVNGEGGAIIRLTPDGRYERHWNVLSSDTERGSHLAIGPDRSVWVSEPEGRRVSRFTFDGTPSGVVDQTRAGRLLRVPVGVAVGPDGTLYVADASLRAIVALSFWP